MQFPCPYCRAVLVDDGTLAGSEVECPYCRGRIQMPGAPIAATSTTQRVEHVYRLDKSPGIAAVLSFFWAGLGQMYNGQMAKGFGFMAAGPLAVIVGSVAFIGTMYRVGDDSAPPEAMLPAALLAGVFGLVAFMVWAWGVVDAYSVAQQQQRRGRKSRRRR